MKVITWKPGDIWIVVNRDDRQHNAIYGIATSKDTSITVTTLPRAFEIKEDQPIPKRAQYLSDPSKVALLKTFFLDTAQLFNLQLTVKV